MIQHLPGSSEPQGMGHAFEIHHLVDQWAGIRDEIIAILDCRINRDNCPCLLRITDLHRPSASSPIRGDPPFASCASRSVGGFVIRGKSEASGVIPADACSRAQVFVVGGRRTNQGQNIENGITWLEAGPDGQDVFLTHSWTCGHSEVRSDGE